MNYTILVVDDMPIFRDPIAASLHLAGFDTLRASNGKEALAMVKSRRPDLILLDIAMPEMDGLTFLEKLRETDDFSATPVILLTAIAEKRYVVKAKALGANDYMLKSRFRLKDLLERIHRHLPTLPAASPAVAPPPPLPRPAAAPSGRAVAQPGQQADPARVDPGQPSVAGPGGRTEFRPGPGDVLTPT